MWQKETSKDLYLFQIENHNHFLGNADEISSVSSEPGDQEVDRRHCTTEPNHPAPGDDVRRRH